MGEILHASRATWFSQCPRCRERGDLRGPFDTAPSRVLFTFTRSWYCRVCWWKFDQPLIDVEARTRAEAQTKTARRPSDRR